MEELYKLISLSGWMSVSQEHVPLTAKFEIKRNARNGMLNPSVMFHLE